MDSYELIITERDSVVIAIIKGYFNADAGEDLNDRIDRLALAGKVRIIIDFSDCTLLNSPGVTSMVDITLKVSEDFDGKLVFFGLDQIKYNVLRTVHVIPPAEVASSLAEAYQLAIR